MPSITLRAFAKINLSLRVKDARADGFHELQTVYQTVDLHDRVTCATARGPFEIRCSMSGVPTDRTNLVWKAAQRLWEASGRSAEPRDTVVTLAKRIPPQAGLGGGSSNAASALLGLRRLWRAKVADAQIRGIAAELGSDVPYFLVGGTALGLGRGEEVYPLEDLPPSWVVLVLPPFGVSTKDAYAWLDEDRKRGRESFSRESAENDSRPLFRYTQLGNDLEVPVIARHPTLGAIRDRLTERGALVAAMSGSGSTVFGVFSSRRKADEVVRKFAREGVRASTTRFQRRRRA